METLKINKLDPDAIIPTRATNGSAGFDLYALLNERIRIWPGQKIMFRTGIRMAIPKGYFGAIYAKSGLSVKHGIRPATCVSVIDDDYRQEVMVPLVNEGERVFDTLPGDRIAQIVFQKYNVFEIEEADDWQEDTERTGGFGSTGR